MRDPLRQQRQRCISDSHRPLTPGRKAACPNGSFHGCLPIEGHPQARFADAQLIGNTVKICWHRYLPGLILVRDYVGADVMEGIFLSPIHISEPTGLLSTS